MGINVSRVKIENLHVKNYESSDSESEDEIVIDNSNAMKLIDESNNVDQLIDIYYKYYDDKYYLKFPEFATNKLRMNRKFVDNIPKLAERTREDVKQWFIDSKITYKQIIFAGW